MHIEYMYSVHTPLLHIFQDVTVLSVCGNNDVADFVCDSRKRYG